MKIWHDTTGRTWATSINVGTIKRVKRLTGKNILDLAGGELATEVMSDPCLLCDILYAIHQPEAEKQGISDIQFGESLAGDSIEEATDALMAELVDFFPNSQRRELLASAMKQAKEQEAKAIEKARNELAKNAIQTA
ncbi:MAG: hypothetical protein IKP00_07045 [Victivallales bacterium]|nr:hypothetical protein [Victivallales bacterium]